MFFLIALQLVEFWWKQIRFQTYILYMQFTLVSLGSENRKRLNRPMTGLIFSIIHFFLKRLRNWLISTNITLLLHLYSIYVWIFFIKSNKCFQSNSEHFSTRHFFFFSQRINFCCKTNVFVFILTWHLSKVNISFEVDKKMK